MLPSFVRIKELSQIPGFSDGNMIALFDVFIRQAAPQKSLEIGTYAGRTAVHIARYSQIFFFIEPDAKHLRDTKARIDSLTNVIYSKPIQKKSVDVTLDDFERMKIDFIHLDGDHTYTSTLNDLNLSLQLLSSTGIIVINDFYSQAFPQITEAVHAFLHEHKELVLLFTGYNKGIICRREEYAKWHDFMLNHFAEEIHQYYYYSDNIDFCVFKTSGKYDCETFGYYWNPAKNPGKGVISLDNYEDKTEDKEGLIDMNELYLRIPNPYRYDNMKFCYNLFETMHVQLLPWKNEKGYCFFSHPCFCYSTLCPEIHDNFSDFVDSPMDLVLSDKRMRFLNKIVAEQDFSMCKNCPKYKLKDEGGFLPRDDFEYLFGMNYGSNCYDGFKYRHLTTILPLTIMFNLDVACNLKCKTCRNTFITKTPRLSDADIENVVYMAKKVERVSFGGDGELFVSDNYRRVLAHDLTKDSKIDRIVLYTNGTMLNEKRWNQINENTRSLIKEIKISIDAATPETYEKVRGPVGWKMLMKNVPFMKELKEKYGIQFSTTYTISKYNVQDVTKFFDFADKELGFDYVMFQFARDIFHPETGKQEDYIIPMEERGDILAYLQDLQKHQNSERVRIE